MLICMYTPLVNAGYGDRFSVDHHGGMGGCAIRVDIYICISKGIHVYIYIYIYILICIYAPPVLGHGYSLSIDHHGGMGTRAIRAERRR